MKKVVAIMLLSVHLFYMGGYALIVQYFIHRSDVQIIKQIYDNKIDDAKLIEIKIPVNLPGVADWADYEQIDGQIQFNGGFYHYVRLKMTHDTMSMICIPNDVKTRLTNANIIIAKQINDVPLSKKGSDTFAKKGGIGQDLTHYAVTQFAFTNAATPMMLFRAMKSSVLIPPYIESPGKPPNVSC